MGAVQIHKTAPAAARLKEVLGQGLRISRRVFAGLWQRDLLITLTLVAILLVSALAVSHAAYLNRALFSDLSNLHLQRDAYQRQWSQLLLEQSAFSAHSHVEREAVNSLQMRVPDRDNIIVVRQQ
ncbi:MAG: cell division protein FtsL [Halomonadaceae bacterium]|nr:MAG: cell division protein FtsL [Halomonadaceae bacterium]